MYFAVVADQAVALAGNAVFQFAGGGELEALLHPALVFSLAFSSPLVGTRPTCLAALVSQGPSILCQ